MLAIRNLTVLKQGNTLIQDLTFNVQPGEILTLLGPSGAGKTTVLRCIAGLEQYQGSITKHSVGFVEQDNTLFPHFTIADNIHYPLAIRKQPNPEAVHRLSEQLGITAVLKRYPHQISGGEQRRAILARTLIYQPEVLLFDEPFAGVDTLRRIELVKLLKQLLTDRQVPVVYVTHDLAEAAYLSAQRLILKAGQMVPSTDPWLEAFLQQHF